MSQQIQTGILIALLLIGSLNQVDLTKRLDAIQEQIKALRPFPTITQGTALPQVIIGDPIYRGTKTNSLLFTTNQFILVY